ncbi:MAG: hypothetical protein IK130_03010 [Oscillospiraceae bacterium]|nr:hypothetical protein [Oscillospiraceae bacterium]
MVEHQPRNAFDIPKVFYFKSGNVHTGSRGKLRYRVDPADGILHIAVWHEDIRYELAAERELILGTAEYEVSEEGFQQMLDYLQQEYEKTL